MSSSGILKAESERIEPKTGSSTPTLVICPLNPDTGEHHKTSTVLPIRRRRSGTLR